ncbi:flagellar FlbD family protein [Fredinandcohnia humi]
MITLTKLNDKQFSLNALFIEQVESFPDTTITLTNGKKFVVKETETEVQLKVIEFYQKINVLGLRKSLEG